MDLTEDEKWFVSNCRRLERIRRKAICVRKPPSSLRDQCTKISADLHDGGSLLPESIRSRILSWKGDVPMPEYDREAMRARFFDACSGALHDLFEKRDAVFSKDFVVWFQNDDALCLEPLKNSHKLIHIRFGINFGLPCGRTLRVCLHCMKLHHFENRQTENRVERYHIVVNPAYFDEIRDPVLWCDRCKQVPLFQILSLQKLNDTYDYEEFEDDQTTLIKTDLFV